MAVPYTFGTATAAIPLSQLDSNFATAITIGNTAVYLGNTTTTLGNVTLTNVTISSGTSNITSNVSTVTGTLPEANGGTGTSTGYYGFKNRIINGAMVIDQRNAGASVTATVTSARTYVLDRWGYFTTQASKFTVQQNAGSVTPPAGFKNYIGITSSSAYTPVAGDIILLQQPIEGYNVYDLNFGSASASTITFSFWVRSSLTGTFGGSLGNASNNRLYPFTFTISSANTWEQKTITVTGDTTGTWATDNTIGLYLNFNLGTGSTYLGTAGAWTGSAFYSATGGTNIVATSGATFYITGVQLEKGSTATSFDYRPYGTELQLCQRYYIKLKGTSIYSIYGAGFADSSSSARIQVNTPIMRTSPTFASSGSFLDGLGNALTSLGTVLYTDNTASIAIAKSGGTWASGYSVTIQNNNSTAPYLEFSSEL